MVYNPSMTYTVSGLAKLAGISVRTLRYYDQIGLLKPSFIKENGYRHYEERELLRLQQILFFRELDFPLREIAELMKAPGFDMAAALSEQRNMLLMKKERLAKLIVTIEKTIRTMKGGDYMKNDDLFASFDDAKMKEYMEEAKRRWGHTEAYRQSMERTKHWTKEDYEKEKKRGEDFTKILTGVMDEDIKSEKVQALIQKHYDSINRFYDCPLDVYRGIGQMYVDDKRFTAYYDRFRKGLAVFMRDAIAHYCDMHKKS